MSDTFNKFLNRGRELAGKAGEIGGEALRHLETRATEFAGQVRDQAAEKMADMNDGLVLGHLEARADVLNGDLTIRRLRDDDGVTWSVDFSNGQTGAGPDFKTAAQQALDLNPGTPPEVEPPVAPVSSDEPRL